MQFEKIDPIYQEFADLFVDIIEVEWDKVLLYSEVQEDSNSIHFVFINSETKNIKTMRSLVTEYGLDRKKSIFYISELSKLVTKLHHAFVENGLEKWNLMTCILESSGKFKVDYEYVDLEASDKMIRRTEWERKYLNITT